MSSPEHPAPSAHRGRKRVALWVLVVAAVVAVAALWTENQRAQRKAVQELADQERRALYERTLRTLQSTCDDATRPQGLEAFCREQAELIVAFPECTETCQALAKPHLARPTR